MLDVMSEREIIDLGSAEDLTDGSAVLRKAPDGRRYMCVRVADRVHVLDDRCPHQGYPLSQGSVRGAELTCAWHNWKFDLSTGQCTFGGEAVKRYDVDVTSGSLLVDVTVDVDSESTRLSAGIRRAVAEVDVGAAVRDGLRLGDLDPSIGRAHSALSVLVEDAATRAPWGFDHAVATLADLSSWVERGWLADAPALCVAATLVAESRGFIAPRERADADVAAEVGLAAAVREERRGDAESLARAMVRRGEADEACVAMLPVVTDHLLAYGHGAIYADKARSLVRRFPGAAEEVTASLAVSLGWATRETSLPPWTATRRAMERVSLAKIGDTALGERRNAYEDSVLERERSAVDATVELIESGVSPRTLLVAIAHAAARRIARFDDAWQQRVDAPVSVLDVTHTLTFADAALAILDDVTATQSARLAVQGAGFVGQLYKADRNEIDPRHADCDTNEKRTDPTDLEQAIETRDASGARVIAAAAARPEAYRRLAPFAALDAAVRPIFVAHTIKMTEAARRLDELDPTSPPTYLEALLTFILPRRPERTHLRTATVAERFLEDGRPPPGLY